MKALRTEVARRRELLETLAAALDAQEAAETQLSELTKTAGDLGRQVDALIAETGMGAFIEAPTPATVAHASLAPAMTLEGRAALYRTCQCGEGACHCGVRVAACSGLTAGEIQDLIVALKALREANAAALSGGDVVPLAGPRRCMHGVRHGEPCKGCER